MPRAFTKKEVAYLDRLIKNGGKAERPLSNSERQIRYRIRKKAKMMMRDLVKAYFAGVIDREFINGLYDLLNYPLFYLDEKYLSDEDKRRKEMFLLG